MKMSSCTDLAPAREADHLTAHHLATPSTPRWLADLAFTWGVIAAAVAVAAGVGHLALYALAVVVVGNRQHALAGLLHEGCHRLVSRRPWLNDALTCLLSAWPMGVGLDSYRRFHFAHHRHT